MPQLDISTYLPQIFWLSIIFSTMLGVFIGIFLPKLSRIFQKRFDVIEQADDRIENLKDNSIKLRKSYEEQKNEILKNTQDQIDSALASVRDFHQKRLHALETEIQHELSRIRGNHGMQSEEFVESYRDVIDEAVNLTLKKLGMQKLGGKDGF
jgi:F-type H+-transporting ATPase subunit b